MAGKKVASKKKAAAKKASAKKTASRQATTQAASKKKAAAKKKSSSRSSTQDTATRELTAKQERFVEEYLVDLNATQAAIRAGYSERTAYQTGAENLRKPEIASRIDEKRAERSESTGITADRVLTELGRIGFSDLRQAFDERGNLKRPEDWPEGLAAAISSVEVVTRNIGEGEVEYVHKLKMWDKNAALEKIAKHLGMFVDKGDTAKPNVNCRFYVGDD